MSAYIVEKEHIDYLINAALRFSRRYGGSDGMRWYSHGTKDQLPHELGALSGDNASEIGAMLWRENHASVGYRYPTSTELPGSAAMRRDFPPLYKFKRYFDVRIDPVQVLKSISCYEYQSCEHPDWYESSARAFCSTLRDIAISELPGYESVEWGAPKFDHPKSVRS